MTVAALGAGCSPPPGWRAAAAVDVALVQALLGRPAW